MAKLIKFNLSLSGKTVSTLDELQEHFSAEILPIYRSGRLLKWLQARELDEQVQALQAVSPNEDDIEQLGAICRVLDLDDDPEVLKFLIEDLQAAKQVPAALVAATASAIANIAPTNNAAEDDNEADDETSSNAPTVNWSGQEFEKAFFKNEDLRNGKFVNAVFRTCDLSGANLSHADLTGAEFYECNLTGTDFSSANLTKASIASSFMSDSKFNNAIMTESTIRFQSYSISLSCSNVSFEKANLSNSNINFDHSYGLNFRKADMKNSMIMGSFFMANFEEADISFSEISISGKKYSCDNIGTYFRPDFINKSSPFKAEDFVNFSKTHPEINFIFGPNSNLKDGEKIARINNYLPDVLHAINFKKTKFTGSKVREIYPSEVDHYSKAYEVIEKMTKALGK